MGNEGIASATGALLGAGLTPIHKSAAWLGDLDSNQD
jgi:hypothetical protein